ncbi:hypothetical protein AAG570_010431 [Ranatra chinensis]|uniref:Intraflagellar transport 20 n=1 Tax=Ranatra chinensis TaxID=642074 RepID=A0ABD0YMI5_9HEMI
MSDQLAKAGLHFDDLNKIHIIEPEVITKSNKLKEEASEFVDSIVSFKKIADGFISIIDSLAEQVEKEKIKAIGAQNLVKSRAKQRDEQQQLQALLAEKTTELERLRIQHQSLVKTENEQLEMIDQILLNH